MRDYATWLERQDPFSADESKDLPKEWNKSLESFLAAQVRHFSGGAEFSVDDLMGLVQVSAVLIVLDGLDEVADIHIRQSVVQEVMRSLNRLRDRAESIQVIVTSRPAAFANSPGFPEKSFPYYELDSISTELITAYAEKWIRARKLYGREGSDVRKILRSKLDESHLRDLARNPMQLSILLHLIHTRGASLPDKRTALYDNYMELFFNRESEKSSTVRDHRYLLIDIHQYLAWILQSEAEEGNSRGSISTERLRSVLEEYLVTEGRDISILDRLFAGMVQRVVALVSRVQGTYEFEVQPIREYFAARHLYETAPYSPPGAEAKGTKPDRFDAIARNFYWLNVTRFYAGCYSKGELPSLADGLEALSEDDGFKYINHPRVLAATLLSDWVFAQHQRSMKEVVTLLLDGLGLRYITASRDTPRRAASTLTLPKDSGRDELLERCFEVLGTYPPMDYALDLISLIKANSGRNEQMTAWQSASQNAEGESRTKWLQYAYHLGLLSDLPVDQLETLVRDDPKDGARIAYLLRANRMDFIERTEEQACVAVDLILATDVSPGDSRRAPNVLSLLARALNPIEHDLVVRSPAHVPLRVAQSRMYSYMGGDESDKYFTESDSAPAHGYAIFHKCAEVITTARAQMELSVSEWTTTLAPWEKIVEKARSLFGDRWALFSLANVASGIRSRNEVGGSHTHLLDHSRSLCQRARYARLRAGNVNWWSTQLETATTDIDRAFVLLVLLSWGSANTLTRLAPKIDETVNQLASETWSRLARSLRFQTVALEELVKRQAIELDVNQLPDSLGDRTVTLLEMRSTIKGSQDLLSAYLLDYEGSEPYTLAFLQRAALKQLFESDAENWERWLPVIRRSYGQGIISDHHIPLHLRKSQNVEGVPLEIALKIAEEPDKYPRRLVAVAEARCSLDVASRVVPVAETAKRDNWFGA